MKPIDFESRPASAKSIAFRKKVLKVGVNDAPFVTLIEQNGRKYTHPSFICWRNMLRRCSESILESRPTYEGVTLDPQWLHYYSFHKWWSVNSIEGWCLDKDLLTDRRLYSPETCIFIPPWLSMFLNSHSRARGDQPIGVTFQKDIGKFRAQCRNPITDERGYLGVFDTAEEAHKEWLKAKLSYADSFKSKMDAIDTRLYPRVLTLIHRMK